MNPSSVIGRKEELATISRLYSSERSEFLAIYGRRRVGKSFLIEEALEDKITFMAVGLYQKIDKDNPEKVELIISPHRYHRDVFVVPSGAV